MLFRSSQESVSAGDVKVNMPFGLINFAVMITNTPFLLCLANIDRYGIYFSNMENIPVYKDDKYPVICREGLSWLLLYEYGAATHYLTEV